MAGYDVFCGDTVLSGTLTDTSYTHDTETPGDCAYTVEAYDAAGNRSGKSAPVSVTPGNTAPSITVSAEPGTENHTFIIRWSDDDPDDSAQISLYYDTDSTGNDGVLIVSGLEEDDETDEHAWDTAGVPAGEYYVYAVISDGTYDPVTAYSGGTVTVTKPAPEIVTFAAEPQTVTAGEPVTLTWEVDNADTVSIDQGVGNVSLTGSATVQPAETTAYTLTAKNAGGTVTAAATVTVSAVNPISLDIISPVNGETVSGPVVVRGAFVSGTDYVAPLTVKVKADLYPETDSSLICDGPGQPTVDKSDTGEYTLVFGTPGIHTVTYHVTDDQGNTCHREIMVNVSDPQDADAYFRKLWSDMRQALVGGDTGRAVSYFVSERRSAYNEVLAAIPADMVSSIIPGTESMEMIGVADRNARYVIDIDIVADGEPMTVSSYLIFEKDRDGLWRIVFF